MPSPQHAKQISCFFVPFTSLTLFLVFYPGLGLGTAFHCSLVEKLAVKERRWISDGFCTRNAEGWYAAKYHQQVLCCVISQVRFSLATGWHCRVFSATVISFVVCISSTTSPPLLVDHSLCLNLGLSRDQPSPSLRFLPCSSPASTYYSPRLLVDYSPHRLKTDNPRHRSQ